MSWFDDNAPQAPNPSGQRTPQPGDPDYVGMNPYDPREPGATPGGAVTPPPSVTTTPPTSTANDNRSDPSEIKKRFPTIKEYLAAFFDSHAKDYSQADWDRALAEANSIYGLSGDGSAKWYPDTKTIGLKTGYYSLEPDGSFKWNDRGPEGGGTDGDVGDFTQKYPKTFSGFYASDFFLPRVTSPFTLPSGRDVLNQDPGYAFRLDQGERAIEQSAAARGLLNSGGTLKNILGYGQSLGSQEYANAVSRARDVWSLNAGNDQDYNTRAWDQYMRAQNEFSDWQNRTFDKYYKQQTLGADTSAK